MFDVGGSELIVIGVVALVVIGPKDLPDMFRQLGRFTAKLKSMSREFSRAMEQAGKESGVSDVAKDLKNATSASSLGLSAVKNAADRFEKWDPIKNVAKASTPAGPTAKPLTPAPMPATIAVATSPAPQATLDKATVATGPATQALVDKAAAKKSILAETAERLKALDALPNQTPAKPAAKPAAKMRTKPTVAADIAVDVEPTILAPPTILATKTRSVKTTSRKSNKVEDA